MSQNELKCIIIHIILTQNVYYFFSGLDDKGLIGLKWTRAKKPKKGNILHSSGSSAEEFINLIENHKNLLPFFGTQLLDAVYAWGLPCNNVTTINGCQWKSDWFLLSRGKTKWSIKESGWECSVSFGLFSGLQHRGKLPVCLCGGLCCQQPGGVPRSDFLIEFKYFSIILKILFFGVIFL